MSILSGINSWENAVETNVSGEIAGLTEKTSLHANDLFLIEDSESSNVKKKVKKSNIAGAGVDTSAVHTTISGEISALSAKAPAVANDRVLIEDAAASFAKKQVTALNLFMGTGLVSGGTAKTAPVAADLLRIDDTENSNVARKSTIAQVFGASTLVSALTEKSLPVAADVFRIDDSAASNAPKKVQIGTIAQTIGGNWWSTRPAYMGAASAYDDEFASDTSVNWTFSPTVSGSAIDAYATTASNPRVSWAGVRASCLTVSPVDATSCFQTRAITLDTNAWLWFRATTEQSTQRVVAATDCTNILVGFSEDATVTNHHVYLLIGSTEASGTDYVARASRSHTAGAAEIGTSRLYANTSAPVTMGFIQKIADAFYVFSGNDNGIWHYHGTFTYSGNTLDTLVVRYFDDGGVPGSSLINLDFIRYGNATVIRP